MSRRRWFVALASLSLPAFLAQLAVAHSSGVAVPVTYAGLTQVLARTTETATPPTPPAPTQLQALAPADGGGGVRLSATLTSLGLPVSGEVLRFLSVEAGQPTATLLCVAGTGADGEASCVPAGDTEPVGAAGYRVEFAGDARFAPSAAAWEGAAAGSIPATSTSTTTLAVASSTSAPPPPGMPSSSAG